MFSSVFFFSRVLLPVGCIRANLPSATADQSISTSCSEILFQDNGDASPTVLCREGGGVRWNQLGDEKSDRVVLPEESAFWYDLDGQLWLVGRELSALPDGPWRKAAHSDPEWDLGRSSTESLVWWPGGVGPLATGYIVHPERGVRIGNRHILEHSADGMALLQEGQHSVGVLVSDWARRGDSMSCGDAGVWLRVSDSHLHQVPPGFVPKEAFQYVGDELVDTLYWLNIDEKGTGTTATRYPPPGVPDQYHTGFRCVGGCVDYVRASHGPDRRAELVSVCSDGRKSARVLDWKPTQDVFLGGSALVIDPHFGYCFAYGTADGESESLACGWPMQ